jgi:hypothetical protein
MKKYQDTIKGFIDYPDFNFTKKSCSSRNQKNPVQTIISENFKSVVI